MHDAASVSATGSRWRASETGSRSHGTANAAVPEVGDASAVLVTREPHGGSAHPTSAPLLRAPL